ncbi:MAG: DUF1553 domain-containing protein, partial [Planctomycetales bacterium]|nr:DUF1553 domain-containing protein [Planctomycetales bacterium]
ITQATANDTTLANWGRSVADRKIGQHPKSFQTRAIDFSLLIFGKPLRTTNCDCERKGEPTLLQSLYVRNDQEMLDTLDRNDGWIAQIERESTTADLLVDDLIRSAYIRTLSRRPTESELVDCRQHVEESPTIADGMRDLMWALLNTQEFIVNH